MLSQPPLLIFFLLISLFPFSAPLFSFSFLILGLRSLIKLGSTECGGGADQVRGLRSARTNNRSDCCLWQEEPNGGGIKRKPLYYQSINGPTPMGTELTGNGAQSLV